MKTKRILSLVLAFAMLAAVTVSASAAQSEVYIYENFDYDSLDDFYKAYKWLNEDGTEGEYWKHSTRKTTINTAYFTGLRAAGIDRTFMYDSTNIGSHPFPYWSLAANSNGDNAYYNVAQADLSSRSERLYFIPEKSWNGVQKADEAFVISYDLEVLDHRFTDDTVTGTYTKTGTKYTTTPNVGSMLVNYAPVTINAEKADGTYTYVSMNNFGYVTEIAYTPDPDAELAEGVDEAGTYEFKVTGFNVQDGRSGAYGTSYTFGIGDGNVHNFTSVITKKSDTALQRKAYHDGTLYHTNYITKNLDADLTIHGVAYDNGTWVSEKHTNFKVYTLKTTEGAFNVSAAAEVVPASAKTLKVKFSQPVNAVTYDKTAVTMTAGGEALAYGSDFTVSDVTEVIENEGGEIYSEATVSFTTDLAEDTDYVITFPAEIENTMSTKLEGYNAVSFSTPAPEISIEAFDVIKGFGTAAETAVEGFTADGTLYGASIKLTNNTEAVKNVAVIYAVYSANGKLNDVVYTDSTVAAGATDTFETGTALSEAGTVKAFIWNGLESLKPYRDATVKAIAAPAAE